MSLSIHYRIPWTRFFLPFLRSSSPLFHCHSISFFLHMYRSYNSSLVSVNTTAPLSHRPSILSFPTPNHLLPLSSPPFLQYFLHNLALRTVGNIVTGDDAQTQLVINLNALPALLWMLDNRYVREGGCERVRESACV